MPKNIKSKGLTYQILSQIKKSRDKEVYRAFRVDAYTGLKQEVILKVFSKKERSYEGELESLLQANSPYCIRLLGFESLSRKKILVLESVEGISLAQLIQTFHLSSLEIEALIIFIHQGLLSLKARKLSHGDLSLDNVLINKQGQIKFIDFGKGNYQGASHGTPPFVAPEIQEGGRASFLSDLFSLGVIETCLTHPEKISLLKQKKSKDFQSSSHPLLMADPEKRFFPYASKKLNLHSLRVKVNSILSSLEFKNPQTQELSRRPLFFSFLTIKSGLQQIFIFCLFGLFAGASHLQPEQFSKGFLQVSTHQWLLIHTDNFKSYAPLNLALSPGWHDLTWETADKKGRKKIFIKSRQTLILNDQDFNKSNINRN